MPAENSELARRVSREKAAHTERDVLTNSAELKQRFFHTITSPAMLRFESAFAAAIAEVKDMHVLDLGCGKGAQALALLRRGAHVSGIDISEAYVGEASRLALDAGFSPTRFSFQVMDAHKLAYAGGTFELVVGRGILHHLDLFVALDEIRRVLRPGGTAVFQEPLADNPLLKLFRAVTPGARTKDEQPLTREDLRRLAQEWEVASQYFGLLSAPTAVLTSILLRPFPHNPLLHVADWGERLLNQLPWLRPLNQYVLMILRKPAAHPVHFGAHGRTVDTVPH